MTSLFPQGTILARENGQAGTADLNAAAPQPAYFDALLQRGKKRQTEEHIGALGELPQLQLGLQDISRKVRNLGQGGPSAGLARGADARAHYLLSASGVNTGQALRDLSDLATSTATRSQAAADQLDNAYTSGVKDTLAQKYQNDFQDMVDRHVQKAQDDFNRMIEEKLHGVDWDAHRQRIYEHFGLKKPRALEESTADGASAMDTGSFGRSSRRSRHPASTLDKSFGLPGMAKSVIGTPGPKGARASMFGDIAEKVPTDGMRPAPEDRILCAKQEKYAERVKELNVARLQETPFPILHKFSEVEAEPSGDDSSMLVHAYKALVRITGEDASVENASDPSAVKERQYGVAYLDEHGNSAGATRIRKRIINGSRKFLESLFYTQLEATVSRNPREANVGGVPTAIAKVKGYVRVRASRKELGPDIEILQEVNGDYCWPVLFYLIRSGLFQEALEYVDDNAAAFRQIDRSFVRYLRAYVTSDEHRLPSEVQQAINNEYSVRSRLAPEDSIDPYRMMCYKLIGRCELQKRSLDGITNDMMDWMWLQFALAREYNRVDEFAHEAFGLEELRNSIKEIGERYFGPGSEVANAPTTLFFMQVSAGLFEKAVADFYPHNYVSATHFAIAFDFYGLLRVSDVSSSDDLLTHTSRQQSQIAFGSLVGLYTRDFRTADATAAVDYLTLICLNGDLTGEIGKRQRELCYQALTEVVLETQEFAQLLGDIRSDGQRIKGAIEQRLKLIGLENEQDFLKHITLVAARTAEEQSRVADAALLFHLAEDYDKVLQVVNEAISLALTTELGEQPVRLTPLKPRTTEASNQQQQTETQGSLSLTAVEDPIQLARSMYEFYRGNQMFSTKIREVTGDSSSILSDLARAREVLEQGRWADVIDAVTNSRLLPTEAKGNISAIRHTAQAFNQLPAVVARTVGYVMLWTVIACSNNVERLRRVEFDNGTQQETIQNCVQVSKDVMVFAGLIRFKLPGRVWEALAKVGGDLGAY
ncbi:nuclear pore complex subunit [Vermiconidia calcicola]|uniref:Nuclear pore complex subunit n=1 Tax=Vermiconidia calcicola TaxID=1690605 RepID=A0ACC3MWW9_9PEZI|nr:nuclear pore complex subunit [Vermiconidia calcicola]